MGAADVVVVDLEHWDRGRLGLVAEHQVAVGLVGVGARRALLDPDQPGVDRASGVLQRALEEKVAGGVADLVVLEGVEVEELVAGGEVDALQLRRRARPLEVGLAADLGEAAAEGHVEDPRPAVLGDVRPLVGELVGVPAPLLERHVADFGTLADEDFGRAAGEGGLLEGGGEELVEVVEAGVPTGQDQGVGEDRGAASAGPELAQDRPLDLDVVGNVEERTAAEQRGMRGGELVAVGADLAEEMAANQVGVLAGGLAQRHEDDALAGQLLIDLDLARL